MGRPSGKKIQRLGRRRKATSGSKGARERLTILPPYRRLFWPCFVLLGLLSSEPHISLLDHAVPNKT
jgi:hypothetical protein